MQLNIQEGTSGQGGSACFHLSECKINSAVATGGKTSSYVSVCGVNKSDGTCLF